MTSVVVDPSAYDWEGDALPRQPFSRTIAYEMHVRGFTRHPSSGVAPDSRGTWGYAPVSFFAPHQAYSSCRDPLGPVDEFRDMVKALHRAGIEVILDVVFNHTAEGDHREPTRSLRGLDNAAYYILESDRSRYANYTGTGNTLNANPSSSAA